MGNVQRFVQNRQFTSFPEGYFGEEKAEVGGGGGGGEIYLCKRLKRVMRKARKVKPIPMNH